MKMRLPSEFLYQVFALLFAVIVVHAAYVGVIRPSADSQLAIQAAQQAAGEAPTGNRSLAIVIKDYEQEACFILMLWALAIMGLKASRTRSEAHMLNRELIAIPEGTSILPRDAREQSRALEALPRGGAGLLAAPGISECVEPLYHDSQHTRGIGRRSRAM